MVTVAVTQVQEVQRVTYKTNPRRNTQRHILIKLTKIKYKEKILTPIKEKQQIKGNQNKEFPFQHKLCRIEGNDTIYTVMKGKKYSPEYSTQQDSHSDSTKNSKTLQARKSQENLVPSNQLYNKC